MERADILVAMAELHQRRIGDEFGVYAPLSEILDGRRISIRIPAPDTPECQIVLRGLVHRMYAAMPAFVHNLRTWNRGTDPER